MSFKRAHSSVGMPLGLPRQVRPRTRGSVSRREAAAIAKRQSINTSTKKSFKFNADQAVVAAGSVISLTAVATGIEDFDRVGNGLLPISITVRWNWRVNSLLTSLGTRVLLIRSKNQTTSAPAIGTILDLTPNGSAIAATTEHTASYLLDRLQQFDILFDVMETIQNDEQNAGNQRGKAMVKRITLGTHPQVYVDGGTGGSNKFFLVCIHNDPATNDIEFSSDMVFIDK